MNGVVVDTDVVSYLFKNHPIAISIFPIWQAGLF